MINKFFDHIYVINLDRRVDRKEEVKEELGKFGIDYEIFSAVDGRELDIDVESNGMRWNKSAYALTLTTIKILEDAKKKGYENILIFEDDIQLDPLFDLKAKEQLEYIPKNYDLLFLGMTHTTRPVRYNAFFSKAIAGFSCHAYAINSHVYDLYLSLLKKLDSPIDHKTNMILGSRLNSYCSSKNLIWQKSGVSDIEGGYYNVKFTI